MIRGTLQSALCLCLSPLLVAQQAVDRQSARYNSQPTMIPSEVIIPKGTRIELISLEYVSSASATDNSLVRFALAKDLVVNEVTVLGAGTPVEGRVSRVRRGVPYRQWGKLNIAIKQIQIGHHSHLRLTSSNPEPSESMVDELAMCLISAVCVAMVIAFAFSKGSQGKPAGDGGQAVLPQCAGGWIFWTRSSFKVSDLDITEGKAALTVRPPITCTNVCENQSRGQVQVR
jgi:hypothetical protein